MLKNKLTALLVLFVFLPAINAASTTKVFVSIAPHSWFVSEIGGPAVDVEILVPSGQSPATYDPTPKQLARLAEADVLFTTGVPFEKRLLDKISSGFDNLIIVQTHAGIELRPIKHHGESNHHDHGVNDPHVWLDPVLAIHQARTIAAALMELDPSSSALFESNLETLLARIDSVSTAISQMLAPLRGRTMYVFHPAYGYFADAFGLHQVAIEMNGKEPSARQLAELIDRAKADNVDVLFIQPQFSRQQAHSIGESIGAKIVTLDPLSGDYLNNLMDMGTKVAQAFGEGSDQ